MSDRGGGFLRFEVYERRPFWFPWARTRYGGRVVSANGNVLMQTPDGYVDKELLKQTIDVVKLAGKDDAAVLDLTEWAAGHGEAL